MRAIRVETYGGPEVLRVHDLEPPQPGPGEVLVDVAAAAVHHLYTCEPPRTYLIPPPFPSGVERARAVPPRGAGATDRDAGDRVGREAAPRSYAEQVLSPADKAIP